MGRSVPNLIMLAAKIAAFPSDAFDSGLQAGGAACQDGLDLFQPSSVSGNPPSFELGHFGHNFNSASRHFTKQTCSSAD